MSRLLPYPIASFLLLMMWLLLTRFSLGHLVLGSVVAMAAALALANLELPAWRLQRWKAVLKLFAIMSVDILRSNIAVAWLLLKGGHRKDSESLFIEIHLTLSSQGALATLAVILTATPGTAWLQYKPETGSVLVHVFDVVDEAAWRALIKSRYEALLLEIFE